MPAQVGAALGEDGVQRAGGVEVERNEHRRVLRAGYRELDRLGGIEQDAAQRGRHFAARRQTSSTRSSKSTSPSSVRWTGHLAAITCRRST